MHPIIIILICALGVITCAVVIREIRLTLKPKPVSELTLKQKWVNALRSGEYKQGKNNLKKIHEDNTAEYCCLGVLGAICGLSDRDLSTSIVSSDVMNYPCKLKYNMENQPVRARLMYMNDHGQSFTEIADWIEENITEEQMSFEKITH